MKSSFPMLLIAAACGLVFGSNVHAQKKYDFEYALKGQPSISPIQVFDNGTDTFFQFAPEKNIPAIFAVSDCGNKVLMDASIQGNFHVVSGRFKTFALQIGMKTGSVTYAGHNMGALNDKFANERCEDVKSPVAVPPTRAYTAVPPTLGDEAAVLKRKKMERAAAANAASERVYQDGAWRVTVEPVDPITGKAIGSGEKIVEKAVVSVEDRAKTEATPKKSSLKPAKKQVLVTAKKPKKSKIAATTTHTAKALVAQPAENQPEVQTTTQLPVTPVSVIPQPMQQQPQMQQVTWEVKAGESIRNTIDQWRRQAGWEMVWSYEGDFTAQASATFQGDFSMAIRSLMNALPENVDMTINLAANKLIYVSKKK